MLSDRDFFVVEPSEGELLNSLFEDEHPLYLEIGSGKGEFISRYPISHPDWNFIGLEMSEKRIRNCLKKLSVELNPNVRLARKFVDAGISQLFRPSSISGVFIQHPDPWPKRKHHRRRLFRQDFLNSLAQILIPGAQVQISTDHNEYASWIVEEFLQNPHYTSMQDDPIQLHPNLDEHIVTWFEEEQRRLGYHPHFMLYERI
ncbi:MAG: tRNA (guanosine(46)-N7)-methyltransferase TrmB [Candidatus Cloacimonadales bacterium]|jgi:tRNA (guanine-N7-)-methyltransferase|nr:tRNA (guanosine(46)-N7)-methyltransferase TrmB [Candidatus Cloacimonadota bacterium]MDY0380625.1 tRNA (guanosine(46)-N7)-methyltransferase TrmB [Candidatus Cloacimonadaceae bacterium]HCM14642.1 tRNA (guanosine(46)-N7)-methyltransferase TrmB [Candidatus Cloacimonas sp.]MCB5256846.1 tRNA (guanosine(46)-N7)-methyltransferase TrmB [Candidatus Cloacimonadota bacterium]MCB5263775.1 tRNA (guanosine(46)-N7)-methyltransferase TrmB [Candidatus Cloacimonadota bacterium]